MNTDQGTRYELAAIVAASGVLAPFSAVHLSVRVIPLPVTGLAMVPVTGPLTALPPAVTCPGHTGPESGFAILNPGLLALIEAASGRGPVAYLEADYTGRDGHQAAGVWAGGRLTLGPLLLGRSEPFVPQEAPICRALRAVGVRAAGRRDEFVVAGLGRVRRTADWAAGPTAGGQAPVT